MFRKRRRPTPHFKIPPPYNPMQGDQANLRQDGISPFCSMMQIAAADTFKNYVVCRGFDPRMLRYMANISVAKPYGKRRVGTYKVGEVYPALLPTQGNARFMDFRNVVYMPPSPTAVDWRVGQNPGVVTGGLDGGQPANLNDAIEILYDNSGKVINWLLVDSASSGGSKQIQGNLTELTTHTSGPYTGKKVAMITIVVAPCDEDDLIGESVEVVDWSDCVFDLPFADLENVWVWAAENIALSLEEGAEPGELTPCHWTASDRCCVDADGAV